MCTCLVCYDNASTYFFAHDLKIFRSCARVEGHSIPKPALRSEADEIMIAEEFTRTSAQTLIHVCEKRRIKALLL